MGDWEKVGKITTRFDSSTRKLSMKKNWGECLISVVWPLVEIYILFLCNLTEYWAAPQSQTSPLDYYSAFRRRERRAGRWFGGGGNWLQLILGGNMLPQRQWSEEKNKQKRQITKKCIAYDEICIWLFFSFSLKKKRNLSSLWCLGAASIRLSVVRDSKMQKWGD